jgi:hypothetical protein
MSDTKNVKLGVCKVTFGGVDLGYTKGGVDVEVKTTTHKVEVDQFGQSSINEYIMGREITAKCPLAETTIENLNAIMPGSTIALTAGTAAAGTMTPAALPVAGDTVTIDGVVFKFVTTAPTNQNQVQIGVDLATTLTNLKTAIEANTDPRMALATFTATATALEVTYATDGVEGNSYSLAASGTNFTIVQMTGGVDDKKRADVTNAVGISLLDGAKVLNLHPIANAADDLEDDLTIPIANTPGQATFAYKLDAERIFNVTFTGYPDPNTKILFQVGDPTAGA